MIMMFLNLKENTIQKLFHMFLIFKWISAGLQFIGGALFLIFSQNTITQWIIRFTQEELSEDSRDYIASHLLAWGMHISLNTKWIIAFYLISHGLIKFYLLYGLWKNKLFAYPLSAIIFSLFMFYQFYRYQFTQSIWLLVLSLFDIFYIILILHEYNILKKKLKIIT